jgi:hypothetical protein
MMLTSWLGVVARCGRPPRQALRRAGKRVRKNVPNLRRMLNMRRILHDAVRNVACPDFHTARPPPNPTVAQYCLAAS